MSIEAKKYEGYWWLPSDPEKKVTGSLFINRRGGIELRTIGSLLPQQDFLSDWLKKSSPEIILGQTVNGDLVTLISSICIKHESNLSISSSDLSTSTYKSKFAVVGENQFNTKNDIAFTFADVSFSLLDEWLFKSGFDCDEERNIQRHLVKFNLEYEYPEVMEFDIASLQAKLKTRYFLCEDSSYLKWHLTHRSSLRITPEHTQKIDWYMQKLESLRRFLTALL